MAEGNLANLAIIVALLVIPYVTAVVFHFDTIFAARLGIGLVFVFAAIGHFAKTDGMMEMLPPSVPARRAVIHISGVFELILAAGVVVIRSPLWIGLAIIAYLIAIFPSNVY